MKKILNHDDPIKRLEHYNTTDDLLEMLEDAQYSKWFRNSSQKIFIALCFKTLFNPCSPDFNKKEDAINWMLLVDEFFKNANQKIESLSLNGIFIYFVYKNKFIF